MEDAVSSLRQIMSDGDYQAVVSRFEANAGDLDRNIAARLIYAEALFRADRTSDARAFATETRSLFPSDIRSFLDLGHISFRTGDDTAALECYGRARRLSPTNMWPYYRTAQVHRRGRDYRAEVDILRAGEAACHNRVSDAEYQVILKELASARSLLAVSAVPGYELRKPSSPRTGRMLDDCLHVTMVKDEEDMIYSCLSSSFRLGFRKFVVADNGSTDGTPAEIRRFAHDHPEATTFVVSDPVAGYYQDIKTMALINYARTVFDGMRAPIRWAFPLDADEELQPFADDTDMRDVVDAADRCDARMIVFAWSHAASPRPLQRFDASCSPTEAFPLRSGLGHSTVRKCAFRIDGDAVVEMGAHFARNCVRREADMLIAAEQGFVMVHYAVRSIEQSRRKTINGYNALQAASGLEKMGGHWRSDYAGYLRDGEAFFERKVASYIERVRTRAF